MKQEGSKEVCFQPELHRGENSQDPGSVCLSRAKGNNSSTFWELQKGGQTSRRTTVVWSGVKGLSAPLMLSEIQIPLGKYKLMWRELQQVRSYFDYNNLSFLASGSKLVTEKQLLFPSIHLWHLPPTSPGTISPIYFTLQVTPFHELTQSYHSSCPWTHLTFLDRWKYNSSFTRSLYSFFKKVSGPSVASDTR